MKSSFKSIYIYILKVLQIYPLFCLRKGFLKDSGWLLSFHLGEPVDKQGNPLPWMTYSAIYFLESKLTQQMNVFEYGCGNSTLWWSKRVNSVTSCEHNLAWFQKVKEILPCNVVLYHVNLEYGGEYCQKISDFHQKFDIIVIDGRDRINCAINSLNALKKGGIIIWDNSDREEYQAGYQFFLDNNYRRLDFYGIGPINSEAWCTSIFYSENNCLEI